MTIWFRYCFKELFKVFFLFVFSFYFLFVLIDYSAHAKVFAHCPRDALMYYLFQFTKRLDILLPVALLVATVKVLTTVNLRREFTAMVTSGVSSKKLLTPFIIAALVVMGTLFANFEFFQPNALEKLNQIERKHFSKRRREKKSYPVHQLKLKDNTLFVYQRYLPEKRCFFDAFWIKSIDHIYRIKEFDPHAAIPTGHFVDEIIRAPNGEMVSKQRHHTLVFPQMTLVEEELFAAATPPSSWSISELNQAISLKTLLSGSHANTAITQISTHLSYKLLIPFLCLLIVMATAPFALMFGRHLNLFLTYSLALFGILVFFTVMGSALILAESGFFPPFWTLLTPFALVAFLFSLKFAKL